MISAYPLQWPSGWPRAKGRKAARFTHRDPYASRTRDLSLSDGTDRLLLALQRFGIDRQDIVISTNVPTRLDGLPRSGERAPNDPGVAVYWQEKRGQAPRVMAIDIYDSVAGNLGAVAATLDAMRAIERHGGAQILERAFTGFTALPAPGGSKSWRDVLDIAPGKAIDTSDIDFAYRKRAATAHPDRAGGSHDAMAELNRARADALKEIAA